MKDEKEDMMKKSKDHQMMSEKTMPKNMPMMDMDEEMGNMKRMCKMVAEKS